MTNTINYFNKEAIAYSECVGANTHDGITIYDYKFIIKAVENNTVLFVMPFKGTVAPSYCASC